MQLIKILKLKSVSALTWKKMKYEEMKEIASIFNAAYEGKLEHIQINPHAKVDETKKLKDGKEINSIFPLCMN
jgi:hypothetical protein